VKICSRNDPELNKCLVDSVDKLRPYLAKGIPEFRIPPYDPLMIPKVSLVQGEGPVSFKSDFNNMRTSGAKDVVVQQVEVDIKKLVVTLRLFFPTLRIQSNYSVDGRILVVPVQGNGYSDGNFSKCQEKLILNQPFTQKYKIVIIVFTQHKSSFSSFLLHRLKLNLNKYSY